MADLKAQLEISADASGVEVGVSKAKRSINDLGVSINKANTQAEKSVDRYVKRLEQQNATIGMSAREIERYKLSLRGANDEQLKAADSAIRIAEGYKKGEEIGRQLKTGMIALATVAAAASIAVYAAFDQMVKKAGDFQDMAEKTGDTAENIASLAVAAGTAGTSMDSVVGASQKLTKGLTGVDDESKAAGAALSALGLNIEEFKKFKPADQFEAVGKSLNSFQDGAEKTAVAMALFGKSGAELLPFLKEVGAEGGRQVILTQEQITQADEYADKQAKLRTEFSLHAQAIATQMIPAYNALSEALIETAKEALGMRDGIKGIADDNAIKAFAQDGALLLANLADVAYDVGGAFRFVGDNLGAMAAIAAANLRLDFAGAIAIGKASDQQNEKILKGLGLADKVQARIDAMNSKSASFKDPRILGKVGTIAEQDAANRGKLTFNGATVADPAGKGKAGQEAKAQLAFDLEQIKKAGESITGEYSNAEKIMQAMRSANLVDDREYYASKLAFLNLNSAAQEAALQAEIARMQQEDLTGKAKIDNDRKIVDTQAKLAKVRADTVAGITVNSIAEEAANKKIAQSYIDASKAAQTYIDTIKKQNARDVAGVGRGEAFRADSAAKSQIEDKQTTQRQGLEGDLRRGQIDQAQFDTYLTIVNDTYAKEVEAYTASREAMKAANSDWMNGATEAFANYQTSAENVSGNSAAMFTSAFEGMTDGVSSSISKAIVYGDNLGESLKNVALSVADAFISSFIKIQIQKLFIDKTAASLYAGTIAAQSQAMVAMAGLAAFASTAAIPIVGPALAPGAAAAATALAEGFAIAATTAAALSIASAEGGYDIPGGVNPITQLHEKEMVLPQAQANVIRDLAKSGSSGGSNAPTTIINQTTGRVDKVTEQTLSNGERALILHESSEQALVKFAAAMGDPNSKTSRSMGRNFAMQRNY